MGLGPLKSPLTSQTGQVGSRWAGPGFGSLGYLMRPSEKLIMPIFKRIDPNRLIGNQKMNEISNEK